MLKTLIGIVVSTRMQKTVVVEVTRRKPHPLYRKLLKRSKRMKADTHEMTVNIGDTVKIAETRPVGNNKHFKVIEIVQSFKKEGT